MPQEIIVRYTGAFARPGCEAMGDAESTQISVRNSDGKEEVIFTGCKFSPEAYEKSSDGRAKEDRLFPR